MLVPGAPEQTFVSFGSPIAVHSDAVAIFVGRGTGGVEGIYAASLQTPLNGDNDASRLRVLVDTSSDRFSSFPHAPAGADGLIVFYATVAADPQSSGLYGLDLHDAWAATRGMAMQGDTPSAWPIATLRSMRLQYIIARYDGFDGQCVTFYGSSTTEDAIYTVRGRPPIGNRTII